MRKKLYATIVGCLAAAFVFAPAQATADTGGFTDFKALTGAPGVTTNAAQPTSTRPATTANRTHATKAAGVELAKVNANDSGTRPAASAVAGGPTTNAGPTTPSLNGYIPDDKYRLRVGDRVSFQILEDRDAPKALLVADSGELDVPYVGRVSAVDKTCKQMGDELKALLEKEYYYRATVVLALDAANKLLGRVYVWGQVRNQGPLEIAVNENLTVGKAILRAGGFGDFANKKHVKVIRAGNNSEAKGKQTFELNMVEILEEGKTEKDLPLEPDDSIIVPARAFNF